MKIYEAISDMNIGGAGVLLITRLTSCNPLTKDTTVLIPKGSMLKKRLQENAIRFIEIDGNYDRSFDLKGIAEYVRLFKNEEIDVINCHGCLSCRIAARICKIPIRIYTKHCVFPIKKWQRIFIVKFL